MDNQAQQHQGKKRRWLWWVVGVAVLLILASAFSKGGNQTPVSSTTGEDAKKDVGSEPNEPLVSEPAPIELSGSGQKATQKFTLENGLAIFKMTHAGASNFAITLIDDNGEKVELLVNEIGKFDGAKAVGIVKKGEYVLDISANGKWNVTINQPRPVTAETKPKTYTGVGQGVSPFVKLDKGLTTFELKHKGTSNFVVLLKDSKGSTTDLLVNEIGDFDGSKAVGIAKTGIYLLDISADGEWSISIR